MKRILIIVVCVFLAYTCYDPADAAAKTRGSPLWKVGDCVQAQTFERFETPEPIIQILEIGKKKYLTRQYRLHFIEEHAIYFFASLESEDHKKVTCPSELTSP